MDIIILPLFNVLSVVIELYINLIIVSVIFTFLLMFGILSSSNRYVLMVGNFFYSITEPVYRYIRKVIPPIANIDFSPLIFILGLMFVREVLARLAMKMI